MTRIELNARDALRLVVCAGYLAMLGANLPGHLTYDSVAQLHEGHFGVRETWGPPFYAWLLGLFDGVIPGTGLYVAVSGLLLFASLAALPALRPRAGWTGPVAALFVVLTPQVLIYQAIVWKDVLFASLAVASLACLAGAGAQWERKRRRWAWLAAALVLLAAGAQVRQNGVIVAPLAAIALGWIAARASGWKRGVAWGLGGLVAVAVVMQLIGTLALASFKRDPGVDAGGGVGFGVRVIEAYDLVGAMAFDPTYRLEVLRRARPDATAVIEARAKSVYSGERVDLISRDQTVSAALATLPRPAIDGQWLDLALRRPGLYLRVRWEDFRWVVATPVVDRCLPVAVGVDAPAKLLNDLGMSPRRALSDRQLSNYVTWWLDTPGFSHLSYVALSLLLAGFLLWRRQAPDLAMAALQLSGVAFAASFLAISIACDYRYLYFTDLAALAGLVYVAIDPSLRDRGKTGPA
jgi:4-amino-4-deoxy-L-arabinose transferase-like glycosyltransferase